MSSVKVEGASWIITLDRRRRIITDASILVEDGLIKAIDKAKRLKGEPADIVIDGRNKLVSPGFVNCHMHISYAHAVRGIFPDDLPANDYLAYVFQLQAAMKPHEEYYTSLLALTELLRNGCTCILEPGSIASMDSGLNAIERSGIRAIIGRQVVDLPNPLNLPQVGTDEAIKATEEAIRRFDGRLEGRVMAWAMPFSPNYCSDELLRASKDIADSHHTGVTLHASMSEADVEEFKRLRGKRPVEHLAEKGVLGKNVLLSHAVAITDTDVELLARSGSKVVHCPSAAVRGAGTTKLGRFPEMLEKGICVSLGIDAANSSYYLDPIRVIYLAAILYKDARQSRKIIPAETALEMGTINGAEAIGLSAISGSIQEGKRADLVLLGTRRPEWRSLFYPVNNLVYSADGRSVDTVLVDGRVVVDGQRPVYVDEEVLYDKVQEIGQEILQRTKVSFKYKWPLE